MHIYPPACSPFPSSFCNCVGCTHKYWWGGWDSVYLGFCWHLGSEHNQVILESKSPTPTFLLWWFREEWGEHLLCAFVLTGKALELRCLQVIGIRILTSREQDFDTETDLSIWTGIIPHWTKLLIYLICDKNLLQHMVSPSIRKKVILIAS